MGNLFFLGVAVVLLVLAVRKVDNRWLRSDETLAVGTYEAGGLISFVDPGSGETRLVDDGHSERTRPRPGGPAEVVVAEDGGAKARPGLMASYGFAAFTAFWALLSTAVCYPEIREHLRRRARES